MGFRSEKILPVTFFVFLKLLTTPEGDHFPIPQMTHQTFGLTQPEALLVNEYHSVLYSVTIEILDQNPLFHKLNGVEMINLFKSTAERLFKKVKNSREDWDMIRVNWQDEYMGRWEFKLNKERVRRRLLNGDGRERRGEGLGSGLGLDREVYEFGEGKWDDGNKLAWGLMVFEEDRVEAQEGWC